MTTKMTRRSFVAVAGGALAALAGCSKDGETGASESVTEPEPTPETASEPEPEPSDEPGPASEPDSSPADPELPFAGHTALVLSALRCHEDDQGWGDVDTLSEATYDDQGRMTRKVLQTAAVHLTIDYDYDDEGRPVEAVVTQQDEYQMFAGTWTCVWSDDGLDATWDFVPEQEGAAFHGHLEVSYNEDGTVLSKSGEIPGPQNYFKGSASYTYDSSGQVESVVQRSGDPMSQYEQSWVTWLAYDPAGRLSGYRDAWRDRAIRWQYDDDNNLVYLEAKVPFSQASYTETFIRGMSNTRLASRDLLSGDFTELWATPPADATIELGEDDSVTLVTTRLTNGTGQEFEATYQEVTCPEGFSPTPVASLVDPLQPSLSVDEWMWLDDYPLFQVDEAIRCNRAWLETHADEVSAILENRRWVRGTALETGDMADARAKYANPIAAYSRAMDRDLAWTTSTDPFASWLAQSYSEQIGGGGFEYAFCDLDNDGSPEMLVRPPKVQTMDIWTLEDDVPVLVLGGGFFEGEAQRIEPTEDGYAILSGASGIAEDCWSLVRLEGTEAVTESMVYGDGVYGYTRIDYDLGEEYAVSEGEYLKLYGQHPLLLGLKWIAIQPPMG